MFSMKISKLGHNLFRYSPCSNLGMTPPTLDPDWIIVGKFKINVSNNFVGNISSNSQHYFSLYLSTSASQDQMFSNCSHTPPAPVASEEMLHGTYVHYHYGELVPDPTLPRSQFFFLNKLPIHIPLFSGHSTFGSPCCLSCHLICVCIYLMNTPSAAPRSAGEKWGSLHL